MKEVAFKTKLTSIMLMFGMLLFCILSLLSVAIKPNGWIVYLIISIVMIILFIVGFCYELHRPNCLIKLSDGVLCLNIKSKWIKINIADMTGVEYRKIQSGRMVMRSGTLRITTKNSSYTLSNVKNVEEVTLILRKLSGNE